MAPNTKPLRNELAPKRPISPWTQPPNTYRYKVKTGDSWITLGSINQREFGEDQLIWINFQLSPREPRYTDQVNWYLRQYVGCCKSLDGGKNWAFTNEANPGYIYLPHPTYKFDPNVVLGSLGVGAIDAPQYNDKNAYDTIEKALDIFGAVDLAIGVSEVALPLLIEAGFIIAGPLLGAIGPLIALGSSWNDALKANTRQYFFSSFCSALVMTADGWVKRTDRFFPPLRHPPLNAVFPEKTESFRQIYNFGLMAGKQQGRRMNSVDKLNLFTLLRSKLRDEERALYPKDGVADWHEAKQRDYYIRLASILKDIMLSKGLKVKLH